MALQRYGNFAVEWTRVYAARRVVQDGRVEQLLLYVDAPHLPAGQPTSPSLNAKQIATAWEQVEADRRFILFGDFAVDRARICAVALGAGESHGNVGFELGANRGVNLVLPAEVVRPILDSVPEPRQGGH
jgi:hypothetical protein